MNNNAAYVVAAAQLQRRELQNGHAASHGTRKGAAVHCTSGTTCPPPMTSVARRGEWSLGKIYEIYWLWAESGDQYCGRILVGYDPMSTDFDSIPPHFIEGLENEFVKQAMERTYPNIGTDEDKTKLPEETAQNKKRKRRSS